ncbi:other/NAK protein kinase [Coprinopsis sp. MPI-PUGE-AT-0042]|nr:other/NAK protein kinase [Coprinopsis sp. MPI-PUGE-AT-0042]
MASQQAYQAYAQQAKGTLIPGQTISVNKYTVQVERYLSQGGFAHVYLVRTPTPVYNTTHHVLKRIAVANEAMLSEVKREVDVMRVLRGHPNIVHLIDAAWHRLPNGTYEVFILMEYCPGGGIIDMMNRRLRERLTEAEILQIFVDVCEGVAFMHNSRPPLLHRDLKVENILQSSPTSYKLCDFGSATTVGKPPTNTAEIRALEADLGRHTTMQYRAPEMIDLYSKRPVDEKSDIWALGVLLYKLCYYTTPFEEHGSLAILNVQYRIPPYPVYSNQMNMLIASMLREHGTQRPSIFEMLKHVHHLRGTKSLFNYQVPAQQPLMPRQPQLPQIAPKPNALTSVQGHHPNAPRQTTTSLRSAPVTSSSSPQNQGVQAREKVLEAIAPMRRGRPTTNAKEASSSRQPSPAKPVSKSTQPNQVPLPKPTSGDPEPNWLDKEEASWKTTQSDARERANALFDEAWNVSGGSSAANKGSDVKSPAGFGDDFGDKLWRSSNPNDAISPPRLTPKATPPGNSSAFKPHSHTGSEAMRRDRDKDAFEGLGLMTSIGKPAPTLAEARKLRTGLATMSSQYGSYKQPDTSLKPASNAGSTRPSVSPRPSYLGPTTGALQSTSRGPSPNPEPWKSASTTPVTSPALKDGPIESRFPSLEELDARFTPQSLYPASAVASEPRSNRPTPPSASTATSPTPVLPPRPNVNGVTKEQGTGNARPSRFHNPAGNQATMDALEKRFEAKGDWKVPSSRHVDAKADSSGAQSGSATMRYAMEGLDAPTPARTAPRSPSKQSLADKTNLAVSPSKQPRPSPQQDWLTGDDDGIATSLPKSTTGPVVRDTPLKRGSVIVQNDFKLQSPAAAQYDTTPVVETKPLAPEEDESPTVTRFTKNFPPIDTASANENAHRNEPLTDNWSPVVATKQSREPLPASRHTANERRNAKEPESPSSAEEDGPEDLGSLTNKPKPSVRMKHKARQSSVHELVDLWGGKPTKDVSPSKPSFDKPAVKSKPRPSSLMPPGRTPSIRSVSGSPRISPSRRAPSPQPSMSPAPTPEPPVQSPPLSSSESKSGRSRPQSMFLFPSKSTDNNGAISLSPPPEDLPSPRPTRRQNSITNVVQRYEAIGGKVIAPQQVTPASVTRKVSGQRSTNIPPSQNEVGRVKVLPVPDNKVEKIPSKDEFRPTRIGGEPRTRATSNVGASRPPLDLSSSGVVKPGKVSPVGRFNKDKDLPPSPRKSTFASSAARPKHEASNSVSFPKRKPTLPPGEELPSLTPTNSSSNTDRNRPSSPEKPFQGVGKLIDQWQRKSGEAEGVGRPIKRTIVSGNRG